MTQIAVATQPDDMTHDERAMNLLVRPSNMWTGQLLYLAANIGLWWLLKPLVPASRMAIWEVLAILCFASMAGFHIAYIFAERRGAAAVKSWMRYERFAALGDEILAIASIFLLLPFAGQPEMIFATAFFIGYIPSGILSEPGNVLRLRRSVILVLGALAVFYFLYGGSVGQLLSIIVAGYAAFLLKGINSIHKIVASAISAREEARISADALSVLVDEVSAERDAKTRFIASASHDLGQPLQAARLFSEQLADASTDTVRDRAQNGLDRALTSAQQMLSHMLNHMRLEADAVTPLPKSVALDELKQRVATQFEALASHYDFRITTAGGNGPVLTDAVLLERALGNLVQNAILHSGGNRLLIGSRKQAGVWSIWVIDNGVGIAADEAASIFDDYAQGRNAQSQIKGGFGLGLASVRRISRLLGGDVRLDPRWTKGAAFCIRLPGGGAELA